MPKLPLEGGCHCGSVRYRISRAPLMVYNCHCTNCQKISASAFNISATVFEDAFEITGGAPARIEWSSDVGTQRYGLLCGTCGTRIVHGMTPTNGFLSLRGGTLDDTSWLRPVGDIWTSSAQSWVELSPERLQYERQPEDYGDLVQAFADLAIAFD